MRDLRDAVGAFADSLHDAADAGRKLGRVQLVHPVPASVQRRPTRCSKSPPTSSHLAIYFVLKVWSRLVNCARDGTAAR